jgi:hypothetical protein
MTGPRPNPLSEIAQECLCVEAPFTATVQELHLVALHVLCAAMDAELGVCAADEATTGSAGGDDPGAHRPGRRARLTRCWTSTWSDRSAARTGRAGAGAGRPGRAPAPGGAGLAAQLLAQDGHEVVLVTAAQRRRAAEQLVGALHPGVRSWRCRTPGGRRSRSGSVPVPSRCCASTAGEAASSATCRRR